MTRRPALRLVLASSSPRRRQLLGQLGVEFAVQPVDVDEAPGPGEPPDALVRRLALTKARAAAIPGVVALGADTVVAVDGEVLGKPRDDADAGRMLRTLSGREHDVWTGVAAVGVGSGGDRREAFEVVRTGVVFRPLAALEIVAYVAGGEPRDKAGAYAVQGAAAAFVDALHGPWTNVVGLPLEATASLLKGFGLEPDLMAAARGVERGAAARLATEISRRP